MQRFNDPVPTPSPRRGDLRQPTINSFTPFSRAEDVDQLEEMSRAMRALIREDLEFVEARTIVDSLQGHQDIKDMFASLDGMFANGIELVPVLRRLADILELIDNKLEALEAQGELEGAAGMSLDDIANADTDVEIDTEPDDEEDVSCRFRF